MKSKKLTENELWCIIQIDILLQQKKRRRKLRKNSKKLVKLMAFYQMLRKEIVMIKVMILMIWKEEVMGTLATSTLIRYSKHSSAKEEVVAKVEPNTLPSVVKVVCQEDFLSNSVNNIFSRIMYIIGFSYLLE